MSQALPMMSWVSRAISGTNDHFLPGYPTVAQPQEETDMFCLLLEMSSSEEGVGRQVAGILVPAVLGAGNQQAANVARGGKGMVLVGRLGLSSKGRARGWVFEGREGNLAQVVGEGSQ